MPASEAIKNVSPRIKSPEFRPDFDWLALEALLATCLFRHDPAGLNHGGNTDEYAPEAACLLRRLPGCHSPADVSRAVAATFAHWFGAEVLLSPECCARLGEDIWKLWRTTALLR